MAGLVTLDGNRLQNTKGKKDQPGEFEVNLTTLMLSGFLSAALVEAPTFC